MAEYIEKWSIVNRLIDIENEFQQYKPFHGFEHAMYRKICEAEIAIGKTQAVDAVPVRHGHWETNSDRPDTLICSVCKCGFDMWKHDPHNFCPNCGAKKPVLTWVCPDCGQQDIKTNFCPNCGKKRGE